jgi:hypothetical protein
MKPKLTEFYFASIDVRPSPIGLGGLPLWGKFDG